MFTINRTGERSFGSDGCQVPIGNSVCGETKTLDIINEFKKLYEEKMQEIDNTSCGDCLQEKIKLQQDWIGDLTEQNEMLVRAVEELEQEATERVRMLEEKLQRSAECICEVMKKYREYDVADSLLEEPRKRIFNLENDMKNLLELLRRIRRDKDWSLEGLTFYDVTKKDLFEENTEEEILSDATNGYLETDAIKAEKRSKSQDGTIKNLETKVRELDEISRELLTKKKECESLQKSMIDMRQALTEEVAMKHDAVLKLKRECQELEERCIQADKQTAFRDDIIKELRKEIKQIKQQMSLPEKPYQKKCGDILRNARNEEHILVINHTKKIVQSGKSTVIYLEHANIEKDKDKKSRNIVNEHIAHCTKCRSKFEETSNETTQIVRKFDEKCALFFCKSENDLTNYNESTSKTVKERSKLTLTNATIFRRNNTIVGTSGETLRLNAENTLGQRNVCVPNHISVRTYVKNLELNKKK